MAEQVGKCNINDTLLLQNAGFNVEALKKEECQEDYFEDVKVEICETAIISPELQDNLICDKVKQYDISTTLDNIKQELSLFVEECDMVHDSFKIEKGINVDDIKIEYDNVLLYCEDCQVHYKDYCAECGMLVHILNRTVPIEADNTSQSELPNNNVLEIQYYSGESHIFALKVIPVGVKFGPFIGLDRREHSWKIKGGKFVVNKDKSAYLNWMQYINLARSISEQNLHVFQYEGNLYYQSSCQIQQGDKLLVYFGEEYEDSLNRNIEMDFIPTAEYSFKDAFACTFCCLGFSSKYYLLKHKTVCSTDVDRRFSIEELTQCPHCKIHLAQKEYTLHHMAYCCKINDRRCILPTPGDRTAQVSGRKSQSRQMYKCQQCKFRTKYKEDLKNHTGLHYEVKMFKCGICRRRYKTKEVLRLHVENTHVFGDVKEYSQHSAGIYMKAHVKAEQSRSQNELKQLKCSICEFRTKYKRNLKMHVRGKHLKKCNYKCDRCDYKTNVKTNLKTHIQTRHLKEFKYKCDTCDYKSNIIYNLKIHIEVKHSNEFRYKCDMCDYKANRKQYLKRHIEATHLKEFKYKCDTCDYKTNHKQHLQRHIEAIHLKDFKYKCDTCDYKSNFNSNLKQHTQRKHLKEYKYKCDRCEYKTYQKQHLKQHISSRHLKEFEYKCDLCDYKTNQKFQLKRHVEGKHLKEFKYRCDSCDYKTNNKWNLKTHIESRHMKEFKYQCDACDYKANQKQYLKRHVKAKHLKEFYYICDICEYKTNVKSNLERHKVSTTHSKSQLDTHAETIDSKEFKYKCDTSDYQSNILI